jgi:Putative prokaryotic signal transducing protein
MAQDPEDRDQYQPLNSHALDLVPLYDSLTVDAEVEADVIRGLLDSNGIPSLVRGAAQYPSLGFQVMVPRGMVQEARRLIAEALAAGPAAAEEAEASSEEPK